ncbi:hypothetical protein Bhyg_08552 [Pseudolycoriella hygida]|uniref:Uncharacterized protein n=1 Tax=Pseudolycoriella hygida TaxID=35572 RepID=A0A9Q0S3P9_9DIPT|nr:hypothetical protein Bhyg_08552 [Pseudolycoriella hygida]
MKLGDQKGKYSMTHSSTKIQTDQSTTTVSRASPPFDQQTNDEIDVLISDRSQSSFIGGIQSSQNKFFYQILGVVRKVVLLFFSIGKRKWRNVSTKSVSAGEKKPASTVRTSLNTQSHSIAPSGQQSSLTGKIDCIEARIKRIEEESCQRAKIAAIENEFAQLKSENSDLRLNLDKLKADLESVQYLVLELQHSKLNKEESDRRISELSSENAVLKLEIAGLKTNITGSTATTNSQHQQPIESNNIVSFEQEQLNSNILIRGADSSDPASDIEPDSVFEHIRKHLGIQNDESFDPLEQRLNLYEFVSSTENVTVTPFE